MAKAESRRRSAPSARSRPSQPRPARRPPRPHRNRTHRARSPATERTSDEPRTPRRQEAPVEGIDENSPFGTDGPIPAFLLRPEPRGLTPRGVISDTVRSVIGSLDLRATLWTTCLLRAVNCRSADIFAIYDAAQNNRRPTVSEQEFRRAMGYANSAIHLLKRALIPPYPQFYELLYTYATGVNPALNARINAIFREGNVTTDVAERLYDEFLRAQDANERVSGVSERISHRIVAMNEAIDTAGPPRTPIPRPCRSPAATFPATSRRTRSPHRRRLCWTRPAACRRQTSSSSAASRPRAPISPRCSATSTTCAATPCSTR